MNRQKTIQHINRYCDNPYDYLVIRVGTCWRFPRWRFQPIGFHTHHADATLPEQPPIHTLDTSATCTYTIYIQVVCHSPPKQQSRPLTAQGYLTSPLLAAHLTSDPGNRMIGFSLEIPTGGLPYAHLDCFFGADEWEQTGRRH